MTTFDVVVVGSLNLDLVALAARLPGPGETVQGSAYTEVPGGKGLNQAVAARRAGATVAIVGAVGDDAAGERLRAVVRDERIDDAALATVADVSSGRALIAVDDRAENSIVVVAGSNATVDAARLPAGRVLLAQREINADAVAGAFEAARRSGATTILNTAPAERTSPELLALCDVIVANEHELSILGGFDALDAHGVPTVIVTRGAAGADLVADGQTVHIDAFPVDAVDTTGAGDAFCGVLAARLAGGASLVDACRAASAAGAIAATRRGAVPSLPTAAEIDAVLAGAPVPEPEAPTSDAGGRSAAQVATNYLAALSGGIPDRVADLVTVDFVNDHASALGSGCVGREEYRRRLPGFMASFDGLDYAIERLVVDGPIVAATYRMTARSGGSPIDIRGVMVIETRDGLVARRTDYWDALTFLRQTGQAD